MKLSSNYLNIKKIVTVIFISRTRPFFLVEKQEKFLGSGAGIVNVSRRILVFRTSNFCWEKSIPIIRIQFMAFSQPITWLFVSVSPEGQNVLWGHFKEFNSRSVWYRHWKFLNSPGTSRLNRVPSRLLYNESTILRRFFEDNCPYINHIRGILFITKVSFPGKLTAKSWWVDHAYSSGKIL